MRLISHALLILIAALMPVAGHSAVSGDFQVDFSGIADTNPYVNDDFIKADSSSTARIASGVFRAINNHTPGTFFLDPEKWIPGDVLTVKLEVSNADGDIDGVNAGVMDENGNGYEIRIHDWGVQRRRLDAWSEAAGGADAWDATRAMSNGDEVELSYNKTNGAFSVLVNGTPLTELNGTFTTHDDKDLMPYFGPWPSDGGQGGIISLAVDGVTQAGGGPPTLSDPTPTGTLGTETTATVGATSTSSTGDFYAVLSTSNNVSGASCTQIEAGQNSSSASATHANDAAVSTTSPSVGFTGLTGSTLYYYAACHIDANGDSNVVSGSFTTAAADIVATKLIFGSQPGNVVVGQTFGAFTVRAVNDSDALDEDFEDDVTVALQTGNGALAGTLTETAVAGIATFDDVHIDTLNTDAVIRATADGLTAADSDEFDVTAGEGGGTSGFPSSSRLGGVLQ